MKILGMISSGYDGELTRSAAESLRKACDKVYILDGPIAGSVNDEDKPTNLAHLTREDGYQIRYSSSYASDAEKRTALLQWVQHENGPDCFGVVLDSDELLLWGEYLPDFCRLAAQRPITAAGGFPLRLVELDGSVALVASRVYLVGAIERYELSVHTVVLKGQTAPIALPNQQVCYMHGIAMRSDDPRCRSPLQGEPHILHRTMLRDPNRKAQRQHEAEGDWFEQRKAVSNNPDR